jgi:hypothetical protein
MVFLDSILTVKITDFAVRLGRLVEAHLQLTSPSSGEILALSLPPKEDSGRAFTRYIFELQKLPVLSELVC